MDRKSLKVATDKEVLIDFINTYAEFCVNMNLSRGTQRLWKHWIDLDKEMVKRGIFTEDEIARFHL